MRTLTRGNGRTLGWAAVAAALVAMRVAAEPAPTAAAPSQPGVSWSGTVALEAGRVLQGGLEQGMAERALAYLEGTADSRSLGLGGGGRMHVSAVLIRHHGPADPVGDVQGVSNIAAPDAVRIYEWWYARKFRDSGVAAKAGLIDLNRSFVVVEDGANLLNSSFGILPTISGNVPTPIYPEPGWGATAKMTRGRWTTRAGWFLGDPTRRSDPWHQGSLAIAETRCDVAGGSYTLGVWGHSGDGSGDRRGGFYLLAQHALDSPRLLGFVQLSGAAGGGTQIPGYVGAGLDLSGPLAGRPDDHLVAGVASASVRGRLAETSCEFGYVARVTRWLNVQPDLQYVFHPGGSGSPALLAMVRVTLALK